MLSWQLKGNNIINMKKILCKQNKETRCYIMSAVLFFEGFKQQDDMTEIRGEMLLDVLGLTKADIDSFSKPNYSQIVTHLKSISDSEVKHWIITNTYLPVLRSRRKDALNAFRKFCSDLSWDTEAKESMKLTEELEGLKPIDNSYNNRETGSGCLSVITLIIVSTTLFAFTIL